MVNRMNFSNRKVARVVALVTVLLVTPFSVHKSFSSKQKALNEIYYSKPNIASDLDQRVANAYNIATIAKRYNVSTEKLLEIADELKNASISKARDINQSLEEAFNDCHQQLSSAALNKRDAEYVVGLKSEFEANQDRINRSTYHTEAQALEHELKKFPANLLQSIIGFSFEIY